MARVKNFHCVVFDDQPKKLGLDKLVGQALVESHGVLSRVERIFHIGEDPRALGMNSVATLK